MEKEIEEIYRARILEGILALDDSCRILFRKIFGGAYMAAPMEEIVAHIPVEKLDPALGLIRRTPK